MDNLIQYYSITFFLSGLLVAAITKWKAISGYNKYSDNLLDYKEWDAYAWWGFLSLTIGGYLISLFDNFTNPITNFWPDFLTVLYASLGIVLMVSCVKKTPYHLFDIKSDNDEPLLEGPISDNLIELFHEHGYDINNEFELLNAKDKYFSWVIRKGNKPKFWIKGKTTKFLMIYGEPKIAFHPDEISIVGKNIGFFILIFMPHLQLSNLFSSKSKGSLGIGTTVVIFMTLYLFGTSKIILFSAALTIFIHSIGFSKLISKDIN